VQENRQIAWRALLENPQTGERMGFTSLERLFSFLEDQATALAEEENGGAFSREPSPPWKL
jgi:hypothetical protein